SRGRARTLSSAISPPTSPAGCARGACDGRVTLRPGAGPGPRPELAAAAGTSALRGRAVLRRRRRAGAGRPDAHVLDGGAAGAGRPPDLAARRLAGGAGGSGGRRPSNRHGPVDDGQGELPRPDPDLPVRQEADRAGAVAVQRGALTLSGG